LAAYTVADLDRRLGQIDTAIEEAAKRGKTNTALSAMEGQRRTRAGLVDERNREAGTLAALKAERDRARTTADALAALGRAGEALALRRRYGLEPDICPAG
jgi:hypothetical protein